MRYFCTFLIIPRFTNTISFPSVLVWSILSFLSCLGSDLHLFPFLERFWWERSGSLPWSAKQTAWAWGHGFAWRTKPGQEWDRGRGWWWDTNLVQNKWIIKHWHRIMFANISSFINSKHSGNGKTTWCTFQRGMFFWWYLLYTGHFCTQILFLCSRKTFLCTQSGSLQPYLSCICSCSHMN